MRSFTPTGPAGGPSTGGTPELPGPAARSHADVHATIVEVMYPSGEALTPPGPAALHRLAEDMQGLTRAHTAGHRDARVRALPDVVTVGGQALRRFLGIALKSAEPGGSDAPAPPRGPHPYDALPAGVQDLERTAVLRLTHASRGTHRSVQRQRTQATAAAGASAGIGTFPEVGLVLFLHPIAPLIGYGEAHTL